MLRSKRTWAGVVVVLGLIVVGYYAWLGLTVRSELHAAQHDAGKLKTALADGDNAAAGKHLDDFTDAVSSARSHTRSVGWRVLNHLPYVGDDARAIAGVSDVGATVARDALRPLVKRVDGGLAEQLAPHNGRVNLAAMKRLQPVVNEVSGVLDQATKRLSGVNPAGLTRWVRGPFDNLTGQLHSADTGFRAATKATELAPAMLGGKGPRNYLLMFDNNAEVRATGGMPGAWALLRADHGRVKMVRQGTASDLSNWAEPVAPQTKAEKAIYDIQPTVFFQDTNFTPEFPRTAELIRTMWAKRIGSPLDGVLSVDTVTLGYLIDATGPIKAPHGVTLTSANATDELLNGVYRRFPNNDVQDAFFQTVARDVFDKISSGAAAQVKLLTALSKSVNEGRMYLNSFHGDEQRKLDPTQIAGRLDFTADSHPRIGVYLNDATGSKMSYYLRKRVMLPSRTCQAGAQKIEALAGFNMVEPTGKLNDFITGNTQYGIPRGEQLVLVRVYGPAGSKMSNFSFNQKPIETDIVVDRGRPVATLALQLKGGQRVRIRWTTQTTAHQDGDIYLSSTPGLLPAPATRVIPSAC